MTEPDKKILHEPCYTVATASCRPEDSSLLGEWIARQIQSSVLVEEGEEVSLITFALPQQSPLGWALFEEAASSLGCTGISPQQYETKDWQELWKEQGFKRFVVSESLTVVPAWDSDPVQTPAVVLDPHLAFGTGWHETTRQCLEILLDHRSEMPESFNVLDFGSGTGILGISALRLHSGARLTAIDNDEYAVEATRENILLNSMENRAVVYGSWESWEKVEKERKIPLSSEGLSSLILANVTGGVILSYARRLWMRLRPGGILVMSGVAAQEREEVDLLLANLSKNAHICPGERYTSYMLKKEGPL